MGHDSSVIKVTDFELNNHSSIFGRGKDLLTYHHIWTSSGAHPVSYPMCTGGSVHGIKQPEHGADLMSSQGV
jgi:hypothetical protein